MDTYLFSSAGQSTEATHSAAKWSLNDRFMSNPGCIFCQPDRCKKAKKAHYWTKEPLSKFELGGGGTVIIRVGNEAYEGWLKGAWPIDVIPYCIDCGVGNINSDPAQSRGMDFTHFGNCFAQADIVNSYSRGLKIDVPRWLCRILDFTACILRIPCNSANLIHGYLNCQCIRLVELMLKTIRILLLSSYPQYVPFKRREMI